MKYRSFLFLFCVLSCTFFSCSTEPAEFINPYILSTDVQRHISDGISGIYHGKMTVLYCDTTVKKVKKDESWVIPMHKDSVQQFRYSVGGYENQYIVMHGFPISMISKTVSDPDLANALSHKPNLDLNVRYSILPISDNKSSKEGQIRLEAVPVTFSVYYGNIEHLVTITFSSSQRYDVFADDNSWNIDNLQLQVDNLLVDGRIVQKYDSWEESRSKFWIICKGKR